MKEYINIGPTPACEDCTQVGDENYYSKAKVECKRFVELIRKTLGDEPAGARLGIKTFPHDFGEYMEVVCYYDDQNEQAINYAFKCESESPSTWEG